MKQNLISYKSESFIWLVARNKPSNTLNVFKEEYTNNLQLCYKKQKMIPKILNTIWHWQMAKTFSSAAISQF